MRALYRQVRRGETQTEQAITLEFRTIAQQLFQQTLAAIDVETVVRQRLQLHGTQLHVADESLSLTDFKRVIVIALGKASVPLARAAESVLDERLSDGVVITNAVLGRSAASLALRLRQSSAAQSRQRDGRRNGFAVVARKRRAGHVGDLSDFGRRFGDV